MDILNRLNAFITARLHTDSRGAVHQSRPLGQALRVLILALGVIVAPAIAAVAQEAGQGERPSFLESLLGGVAHGMDEQARAQGSAFYQPPPVVDANGQTFQAPPQRQYPEGTEFYQPPAFITPDGTIIQPPPVMVRPPCPESVTAQASTIQAGPVGLNVRVISRSYGCP